MRRLPYICCIFLQIYGGLVFLFQYCSIVGEFLCYPIGLVDAACLVFILTLSLCLSCLLLALLSCLPCFCALCSNTTSDYLVRKSFHSWCMLCTDDRVVGDCFAEAVYVHYLSLESAKCIPRLLSRDCSKQSVMLPLTASFR